jgi:hypothetical protein
MNKKLRKKLRIFRPKLVGDCKIVKFQGEEEKIIEKKGLVQKVPKTSWLMLVLQVISIKKLEFLDLEKLRLLKTPKFLIFCHNSPIKGLKGN